jgi:hypothetical protein
VPLGRGDFVVIDGGVFIGGAAFTVIGTAISAVSVPSLTVTSTIALPAPTPVMVTVPPFKISVAAPTLAAALPGV